MTLIQPAYVSLFKYFAEIHARTGEDREFISELKSF